MSWVVTSSELVVVEARVAMPARASITSSKSSTGTRSTIRDRSGSPDLSVSVLSSATWPPCSSTSTWTSYRVSPTSSLRSATAPVLISACWVVRSTALLAAPAS